MISTGAQNLAERQVKPRTANMGEYGAAVERSVLSAAMPASKALVGSG
jgi:hypothetical protein